MASTLPVIACTATELAFLTSLLGVDGLTGIPDPFSGWQNDEAEAARERVRQALARRRLIAEQPDGSVAVADAVAEVVGTCGYAEATFLVTYRTADGVAAAHHFHMIGQSAVELALQQEAELSCELAPLEGARDVIDRIQSLFRLENQGAPDVPNGRVTESVLHRAAAVAETDGEAAAAADLAGAGLHPDTASALAESLARPVARGTIVGLSRGRSALPGESLGLLEGANGLWLLHTFHDESGCWVDVVPCAADLMRDLIGYAIRQIRYGHGHR